MTRKYIEVEETSPYGEEVDERLLTSSNRDAMYIPGYSDKRTLRDEAIRKGERAPQLDARLHWIRAQRTDGSTDGAKLAEYKASGYELLSWDEAIKQGYRVNESAAQKGEDGNVHLGDLVLGIASKKVAATHYKRNQELRDQQQEDLVMQPMRDAHEAYINETGDTSIGTPTFEIEHVAEKTKKTKK